MHATTPRLTLIPSSLQLARAELQDRAQFGKLLECVVPDNWPPESAADALRWFLTELEADPARYGWLAWYVLLQTNKSERTLVAGIGFKGPPDSNGMIETGYSVLPQYQGQGIAGQMMAGILHWAFGHPSVKRVIADTQPTNLPSVRLLQRNGFTPCGDGNEPGSQMFEKLRAKLL